MHRVRQGLLAGLVGMLVAIGAGLLVPGVAAAAAVPATTSSSTVSSDCPPGTNCEVVLAALKDDGNGCNWSAINRPVDIPIQGINIHTTEGSLESALAEAQDTNPATGCISWNYLIAPNGKIYVQVPTSGYAYDVGNTWFNTHFVQVEVVGRAEDCSTITPAAYQALVKLNRFLIPRFGIIPSSATINGHDTVAGRTDGQMPARHWDPGTCFPWAQLLRDSGAPIIQTGLPWSRVITVRSDDTHQTVQDCPGPNFTGCQPAPAGQKTNFLHVYTRPDTSAPLVSDPYLHPDGSAGTNAEQDWGDKAPTGHAYTVLQPEPGEPHPSGWTKIQYGSQIGWIQGDGNTVPTLPVTVTPKGTVPVAVYGVPMPEASAPGWQLIPYDFHAQTPLTKYSILPGQHFPVAALAVRSDYPEGCNRSDCTGDYDGDGVIDDRTVVIGQEKYIAIWYGHFILFVKAADVTFSLN